MAKSVPVLHVATYRHHHEGMPDWKRLGEHVIDRRIELDMPNRDDLAAASGISYRILGDLETGRRGNYDRRTLIRLERALQWSTGSIKAILEGGNPAPAAPQPPATAENTAPSFAAQMTADMEEDDPIIRIALSDMDEETKKVIVATLLAERKQFVRRRAAELVRDALQNQPTPPAAG